jgi:hypothetical protein
MTAPFKCLSVEKGKCETSCQLRDLVHQGDSEIKTSEDSPYPDKSECVNLEVSGEVPSSNTGLQRLFYSEGGALGRRCLYILVKYQFSSYVYGSHNGISINENGSHWIKEMDGGSTSPESCFNF